MNDLRRNVALGILATLLGLSLSYGCGLQVDSAERRRDERFRPEEVMTLIGVRPGMVLGEAGVGTGYFTFKLAGRVGMKGHVYANDIDARALQVISDRSLKENIQNITTVVGEVEDPLFPALDLDMIVALHAFHDFERKVEWLNNAKAYLKPGASLVLIERHSSHTQISKERVTAFAEQAGYKLADYREFNPEAMIYVLQLER